MSKTTSKAEPNTITNTEPSTDETSPSHAGSRHPLANTETVSATGAVVRLAWILIGPLALIATLLHVSRSDAAWLSLPSALFWAFVGLLLLSRYVDWKHFAGATMEGKATSPSDFKRYAGTVMASSAAAWAAALVL